MAEQSQLPAWAPPRSCRCLVLGAVFSLVLMGGGKSADERNGLELTGACYCRAGGELRCAADLTEGDCGRRCTEELCDDWFWLDRRPCWNWGYGG